MHLHRLPPRAQRGFTLAELMIAVALGLLILAGMTTLFVNNTRAQGEIDKANRQIENGRFAVSLMSGDLRNAGFYGEFDPTRLATPAVLPDPCALTVAALKEALPLHVQGVDNVTAASAPGCIDDVRAGTDVLVLRHTRTCVAGDSNCEPTSAGGPFFQASLCNNPSELDSGEVNDHYALALTTAGMTRHKRDCDQSAGSGTLAPVRVYETHIYFIANNDNSGDGIPTLKRAELGSAGGAISMTIVPLVEGIENLQVEYGIDSSGDAVSDLFAADPGTAAGCASAGCAPGHWRNTVAVKLHLLARNLEPSQGYTDTKSYQLGANSVAAAGDHYKRHVFQAMVNLPNPAGRKLP
jgi:type IV pilus assembly protein PilW